jgi:hypothetical protein
MGGQGVHQSFAEASHQAAERDDQPRIPRRAGLRKVTRTRGGGPRWAGGEEDLFVFALDGWTGPSGRLRHEPWLPPGINDGLEALIWELEGAGPS